LAKPQQVSASGEICHKIYNFTKAVLTLSRFDSSFYHQTLKVLALVAVHTLEIVQAHSQFY